MISMQQGDILKAEAEALVNTVNCVGVMGRGIALQFKKAFPVNYKEYKIACDRKQLQPGNMLIHDTNRLVNPRYIINFPTKRHWRGKSRVDDVEAGLQALVDDVRRLGIRSIAIPQLGCGLGGLDWNTVREMIEKTFSGLPEVHVLLFSPLGAPVAEDMVKVQRNPNMTKGRAALLCLIRRYLQAAMDPFVTLLEIHKLMYFAQETGEPLRLSFTKGQYGPYAENLRHVLNVIEGHFVVGFADAADNPERKIELKDGVVGKAEMVLKAHSETTSHLDSVADLITGFETPYGMELLSTVHWVAQHDKAENFDDAVRMIYAWNRRKKMFREKHIRIAWDMLVHKNWIANTKDTASCNA